MKFRYKVSFCRANQPDDIAWTMISSMKELLPGEVEAKFYVYFDKSIFKYIHFVTLPFAGRFAANK